MSYGLNTHQAWDYFRAHGMSEAGTAGIVGNFIAESATLKNPPDINPHAVQIGGGPGRGIAQWSTGARWDELVSFARRLHWDEWSLSTQLTFAEKELHSFGLWEQLKGSGDVNACAALVMNRFEMPASKDPSGRQAYARQVYALWHSTNAGGGRFILHRLLRTGCLGHDVQMLQEVLHIRVDGDFGPLTWNAVKRWQFVHGLPVDGVVGPLTATSLGWVYS